MYAKTICSYGRIGIMILCRHLESFQNQCLEKDFSIIAHTFTISDKSAKMPQIC